MVGAKKPVAFNSTVKRFGIFTAHPNFDPSGLFITKPDGCNPCLYEPILIQNLSEAIHKKLIDKDPWRYKIELEEWARNLGYRNEKVLAERIWNRTLLGPAWHYVTEPAKYEPACPNVGFGRTPRFSRKSPNDFVPGPGTYYKEKPFKAPYGPHSTRPTFEREDPCRFRDVTASWSLAANRYTIYDKESIAEKSNKVVSLRGPYDLFTGKRDDSTIKNHFNTSLKCSAATWPLALKGSFEKYKNSRFGIMNKTGRDTPYRGRNALVHLSMAIRRPEEPDPATYNVCDPTKFKQNAAPFNSSYDKPPGYQRIVVWPGVGRYWITKVPYEIEGKGHRHVFKSKLGRTIGAIIPAPMNSF